MEFKEFEIQSLFYKAKVNSLPYKAKELPKTPNAEFDLPALTAGIENQGLSCYVPRAKATALSNCISVSANGANTGAMFYQSNDFTVLQDSYALLPIETMSAHAMLYCISAMQYVIRGNYDWSNKAGWERIKTLKITLPTSDGINPDYAYMDKYISELEQERISELEQERISELEQYLSVTGLDDYELTEEDIKTLSGLCGQEDADCKEVSENDEELKEVTYKEFTYVDLFELQKVSNKRSKLDLDTKGTIPLLSSDTTNNGIVGYVSLAAEFEVSTECPYYIVFGDHTRTMNIMTESFCVADNVKVLKPLIFNEKATQYICTVWKKSVHNQGYARHWSIAKDAVISLPTSDGINPDYAYMDKYIRAIEKQVIKGVVDYKDAVIGETRKQVSATVC